MKIITKQEILDFVNSQPNDKKIDMGSNYNKPDCDVCVMVAMGRKLGLDFEGCGLATWGTKGELVAEIENEQHIDNILGVSLIEKLTYGELKNRLKSRK